MIKVLILVSGYNIGGDTAAVLNYFRNMNRENMKIDFLSLYNPNLTDYKSLIESNGSIAYQMQNSPRNMFKCIREFKIVNFKRWANAIISFSNYNHANNLQILKSKGFAIKIEAQKFKILYEEMYNDK